MSDTKFNPNSIEAALDWALNKLGTRMALATRGDDPDWNDFRRAQAFLRGVDPEPVKSTPTHGSRMPSSFSNDSGIDEEHGLGEHNWNDFGNN